MRRWLTFGICLTAVLFLQSGRLDEGGASVGSTRRAILTCTWVDAYESVRYEAPQMGSGMAVIAAPGTRLVVGVAAEDGLGPAPSLAGVSVSSSFVSAGGRATAQSNASEYAFDLPDAGGTFPLTLHYRFSPFDSAAATITALVPKKLGITRGRINGYVMGSYPDRLDDRRVPDRFVEITPDVMDMHLSKSFRVRDFVSNSRTDEQRRFFPKYAVIRYSLILKVEKLIHIIDQQPHLQCKGIRVLSGYRTPDYNRVLPEGAAHSYHQYGLAADIIIDSSPADGAFDDVNMDGKVNLTDAATLAKACDQLEKRGALVMGGIGLYSYEHGRGRGKYSTYHVHVDVRLDRPTRWGYAFRNGRRYGRLVWK